MKKTKMNKGYISKKKAIDELDYAYMHCADIDRYGLSTALDVIDEIEIVDVVQVVHGHWVKTADGAECDNCGREAVYQIIDGRWQYEPWCPHCGARMDAQEEE